MRLQSTEDMRRALEGFGGNEIEIEYHEGDIWPTPWSSVDRVRLVELARSLGFEERSFRIGGSQSIAWNRPGDQYYVLSLARPATNIGRSGRPTAQRIPSLRQRLVELNLSHPPEGMALVVRQQRSVAANELEAAKSVRFTFFYTEPHIFPFQVVAGGRAFEWRNGTSTDGLILSSREDLDPGTYWVMLSKIVPFVGQVDQELIDKATIDWFNESAVTYEVIDRDGGLSAVSFDQIQWLTRDDRAVADAPVLSVTQRTVPAAASDAPTGGAPLPHPAPALPTAAPAWRADPLGRFQYRYWDGTNWTSHVSTHGSQQSDPLGDARFP